MGMNCPVCNIELKMGDRQGVEVSYCPNCRGIWLDRGGLDKIIERCLGASARESNNRHRDHEHHRDHDDEYEHDGRRRKSFLSNLFD